MNHSGQTALILEDNETGRFVLRAILERSGFSVLESADREEALRLANEHPGPIELLIADVVLRSAGGPEVIRRLKQRRPEMALLFVSGFPLEQLFDRGLIEPGLFQSTGALFLQKPFTASGLMETVEEMVPPGGD